MPKEGKKPVPRELFVREASGNPVRIQPSLVSMVAAQPLLAASVEG